MARRGRKKPATDSENPPTAAAQISRKPRNRWNDNEIRTLINALVELKASAEGQGGSFKRPVFEEAARRVAPHRTTGNEPKTWKQCSNKFIDLKKDWEAVTLIKDKSGFPPYSIDHGIEVTLEFKPTWDAFVLQHPDCAKWKDKGPWWYDSLTPVMSPRAKGSNVFHASEQAPVEPAAAVDPDQPSQEANQRAGSPTVWLDSAMDPDYDDTHDEIQTSTQTTSQTANIPMNATSRNTLISSFEAVVTPSPTPSFSALSVIATPNASSLKRPAASATPWSTPSSTKKPRSNLGSLALDRIADQATEFNTTFRQVSSVLHPPSSQASVYERTPVRMTKAVTKALEKEKKWLTHSQLTELLVVLEQKVMVDIYLGVCESSDEEDCKSWIRRKLGIFDEEFL